MDCRIRQTATASPAEPGGLPLTLARACRHSSESKQRADEIDGGGEAGIGFVVTGGDAAELLEALEEVLDQVTPLIHFCVVGNGRCAIRFGWNHGNSAALVQYGTQGVVIESFVGNESLEIDACDQRFDADAIVTLAGQQDKARQVTQRVDESNDLGCQPATRFADSLILSPPFAPVPCR